MVSRRQHQLATYKWFEQFFTPTGGTPLISLVQLFAVTKEQLSQKTKKNWEEGTTKKNETVAQKNENSTSIAKKDSVDPVAVWPPLSSDRRLNRCCVYIPLYICLSVSEQTFATKDLWAEKISKKRRIIRPPMMNKKKKTIAHTHTP